MTQAGVSTTLSSGFTSFDDDNDYGDDEIDDDKEDIRLVTTNAKLHLKIFKSAIYLNKRNLRRVHKSPDNIQNFHCHVPSTFLSKHIRPSCTTAT